MSNPNSVSVSKSTLVQELPLSVFSNSEFLHYGGSAAAIIIVIAILLGSVDEMIGILVSVMLRVHNPLQPSLSDPSS